jgi:ribonuclease PH
MTDQSEFVEIQGTAERNPFGSEVLSELLRLGRKGILELIGIQRQVLSERR